MPTQVKALITVNEPIGPGFFEMELVAPAIAAAGKAGQFVHVKAGALIDPLLRRPISIYDIDSFSGRIKLLYKVVGKGTNIIAGLHPSDTIDVIGPLGKGFTLPEHPSKAVLVGGGIGAAPLLYLARLLLSKGSTVIFYYGADNKRQLVATNSFQKIGAEVKTSTRDGSQGYHGLITDYMLETLSPTSIDFIYTCGPEMMMAQVAVFAQKHNISGEVSLEEYMACGVGACLGCARQLKSTDNNYAKICKDGPVFSIADLEFPLQALPEKGGVACG